jgi:hypothetical protein
MIKKVGDFWHSATKSGDFAELLSASPLVAGATEFIINSNVWYKKLQYEQF